MAKKNEKTEITIISVGKGATGKVPSYMKKFLSKKTIDENTVERSAIEDVLFGTGEKNAKSKKTRSRRNTAKLL